MRLPGTTRRILGRDRGYLEEMWPSVKLALDYVLRERDANGDALPDMEGIMCTYDNSPMFGVAPYVASQWLVGVAAAVAAARLLGDAEAEARYSAVLEKGRARLEATCWNGRYYRLFSDLDGKTGQQDEGCLSDQILGQWATHLANLPGILDPARVRSALQAVLKMNYKPDQGLRNCQWPGDKSLHDVDESCWVNQANTCRTGLELDFASFLIYEGLVDEGLMVAKNVDDRYRRWGIYWDHQEFGGHDFCPMSAWAIVHALAGQRLGCGVLSFEPRLKGKKLKLFFTTADGYGHLVRTKSAAEIRVLSGEIAEREIRLATSASHLPRVLLQGRVARGVQVRVEDGFAILQLPGDVHLRAGTTLTLD